MTTPRQLAKRSANLFGASARIRPWSVLLILGALAFMVGAASIDVAFGFDEPARASDPDLGTKSGIARNLYLEGRQAWETRTPTGLAQAQERFSRAAATDPHFARAYSGLARTLLLAREYAGLADAQAYSRAQAMAQHALAIDPHLAEAHAELGFIDFYWRWRPREAEAQFLSAIHLDPGDVTTRIWFAGVLKLQRRYEEGLAQIEAAQALSPESTQVLINKAMLELEGGQPEAGEMLLSNLEAAQPQQLWPHRMKAACAMRAGRIADYLLERRADLRLRPDPDEGLVVDAAAQGWASGGRAGMLNAQLRAQLGLQKAGRSQAYAIASTYALLGDDETAIDWLHRAMDEHQPAVLGALSDPTFARIRESARMDDIRALVSPPPVTRLERTA